MRNMTFEPARPLDTDGMPWIPTGPGKSFRPLRFAADGWSELMRLEPGSAVGDEPCVVYIKVTGAIEYLGEDSQVIESVNAETQRAVYLAWCREHGVEPTAQISG
jgi:2,4'-dihydroxyacetophenone dioxygenase